MDNKQRTINMDMKWDSGADVIIKGHEFEEIARVMSFFQLAVSSFAAVVARNIQSGVIKTTYIYDDGSPVPAEVVEDYNREQIEKAKAGMKAV